MGLIKGITIKLYEKTQTGTDGFNRPIYKETPVDIENVLVAPASTDDILAQNNLSGKEAVYSLAIPKETHMTGKTEQWSFSGKSGRR